MEPNVDGLESTTLSVKYLCMKCDNEQWKLVLRQLAKVKDGVLVAFVETRLVGTCSNCGHERTFGKFGYMRG